MRAAQHHIPMPCTGCRKTKITQFNRLNPLPPLLNGSLPHPAAPPNNKHLEEVLQWGVFNIKVRIFPFFFPCAKGSYLAAVHLSALRTRFNYGTKVFSLGNQEATAPLCECWRRPVRPSVPRLRFLALAMAKASDYSDVSPLGNNQLLHQLMPQKRLVDTP